jgi:hypothetical protein
MSGELEALLGVGALLCAFVASLFLNRHDKPDSWHQSPPRWYQVRQLHQLPHRWHLVSGVVFAISGVFYLVYGYHCLTVLAITPSASLTDWSATLEPTTIGLIAITCAQGAFITSWNLRGRPGKYPHPRWITMSFVWGALLVPCAVSLIVLACSIMVVSIIHSAADGDLVTNVVWPFATGVFGLLVAIASLRTCSFWRKPNPYEHYYPQTLAG